MLSSMANYGVEDLARALIDAKRSEGETSDLVAFYGARHRALTAALGGSGAVEPERTPEALALAGLMESSVQQLAKLRSPFADFLEAPENIIDLYQQFAAPINEGINIATQAIEDLLVQVIAERFGIAKDARVNDDDLRSNGFDPSTACLD
jgi:hypothetical protein